MSRFAVLATALVLCSPPVLSAQRRAFDLEVPRPIAAADKVWIEELTWMEIRDAIKAGKTTALIVAGSTEQNGPYVPAGKHVFVLRATAEAIARKLGTALIAPAIPFEPGNFSNVPGTIQVRDTTYDALIEDEAESLRANGFKHVILLGDSGGNQRGLERVAKSCPTRGRRAAPRFITSRSITTAGPPLTRRGRHLASRRRWMRAFTMITA